MKFPHSYRCAGPSPLAIPETFAGLIPTPVSFAFVLCRKWRIARHFMHGTQLISHPKDGIIGDSKHNV